MRTPKSGRGAIPACGRMNKGRFAPFVSNNYKGCKCHFHSMLLKILDLLPISQ